MPSVVYEFTALGRSGQFPNSVICTPDAWKSVGFGPLVAEERQTPEIPKDVFMNIAADLPTASTVQGRLYETAAREIFIRASEGHAILVDNGL